MARYIDESKLIQAIIKERDKIPQTIPCAPYELLDVKPNSVGQSQRAGIRKALRCIAEAPTADVVEVKDENALQILTDTDGEPYMVIAKGKHAKHLVELMQKDESCATTERRDT